MVFEFGGTLKEIASKEIALLNLFVITGVLFKNHKYSENVNFEETKNVISILTHP